ncbi:amidohydrolase family protein [Micromonospora sp. NPDC049282]|uniref:N-acyl-D-amino-acid deacylase family protein n=1 Tax=Micromonospora sp. NPDC049282 TaxID=3364269 RepID=UPI00371942A4
MYDVVVRGGTIVDGSGEAARTGDLAIADGRVAAIGRIPERGAREIDADGCVVTPGFVDIHTHFDGQATWDPLLTPSCWHGVTTVVMGNCGVGFAPVTEPNREWLIGLMEGVEDIPGASLSEGIAWAWESFPEYLDAVAGLDRVMDVGAQVPHGAVRAYVMGDRGAANEPATSDDIAAMVTIVRDAMRAGALGFSTSRTTTHLAITGEPVPGTFAAEDELFALGGVLGELGTGVFQLVPAGAGGEPMEDQFREISWMRRLSARTGRPITFGLFQNDHEPHLWREIVDEARRANAEGARLHPQIAGRPFSVIVGLESTHPFKRRPTYQEIVHLPLAERARRMRDPEIRRRILSEDPASVNPRAPLFPEDYEKFFPFGRQPDYEPSREQSVAAVAARAGRPAQEVMYDLLVAGDGTQTFLRPLLGYSEFHLDPIHEMLQEPHCLVGLSDAGAHCRMICDASTPTSQLTHWVRDRTRGERLGLEFVVHKQTRQTAELYGLRDRGLLRPGYKADVNVIDFDNLALRAPEFVHDLPAGGGRLIQKADGYRATLVSGEVTFVDGEHTGARPGRLVRGTRGGPGDRP